MTSTKKTAPKPTKLSFNLNLEDLDPDRYLPAERPAEKCSAVYVEAMQNFALLMLTADRVVDVCEALATHAEDMGLHVPAGLFRGRAIHVRSVLVNTPFTNLLTVLAESQGGTHLARVTDTHREISGLRDSLGLLHATVLHLAETFGLDPDYISGGDEDEDEDEDETENGDDD